MWTEASRLVSSFNSDNCRWIQHSTERERERDAVYLNVIRDERDTI